MAEHYGQVRGFRHRSDQNAVEQPAAPLTNRRGAEKHLEDMIADPNDRRHGTVTGYKYGCRCERCRAASREARNKGAAMERERRKGVLADMAADPRHPSHGTYTGYRDYGCRCEKCRRAGHLHYVRTKGGR